MSKYLFSNLKGNKGSLLLLQRSLANNTFSNFTILAGYNGTGKTTTAITAALSLNCEHPVDGEPCLECKSCKAILESLDHNCITSNFAKINMPEKNAKLDFNELVKEIFVLQPGSDRSVYVLEEAHALSNENLQSALLAHLDSMPSNVYVIMTTTALNKLISPLQRRARIYRFNRLNKGESELLLQDKCRECNISLDETSSKLVLRSAHGVPSLIQDLVKFIADNHVSMRELEDYLNIIDADVFISLFVSLTSNSAFDYLNLLEEILQSADSTVFVEQLKSFYLNVIYLLEGGIKEEFNRQQVSNIEFVFKDKDYVKIAAILEKLNKYSSEEDIKFAFLKIRQLMQGKAVKAIVTQNSQAAHAQSSSAKTLKRDKDMLQNETNNEVKNLTKDDFMRQMNSMEVFK